jgi:hypothetical protein
MKKLIMCFILWVIVLILMPGFISVCEGAFGPTGTLTVLYAAMDAGNPLKASVSYLLAVGGVLPWIFPLAFFAGTIWWLIAAPQPQPMQVSTTRTTKTFSSYSTPKKVKAPKPKVFRLP